MPRSAIALVVGSTTIQSATSFSVRGVHYRTDAPSDSSRKGALRDAIYERLYLRPSGFSASTAVSATDKRSFSESVAKHLSGASYWATNWRPEQVSFRAEGSEGSAIVSVDGVQFQA